MQASVTQFYNRLIANVPHCYPVTEEEFSIVLRGVPTGKADKNDVGLGLDSETAFIAIREGVVQAFIHVGLASLEMKMQVLFGSSATSVVRGALDKPCLKELRHI